VDHRFGLLGADWWAYPIILPILYLIFKFLSDWGD
jgi:hypothetical protein